MLKRNQYITSICLICKNWGFITWRVSDFDGFKSYSIRILIKYEKNKNLLMIGRYIDIAESEFYPPEKLFDRIDSRNFIEQYPEEEARPNP